MIETLCKKSQYKNFFKEGDNSSKLFTTEVVSPFQKFWKDSEIILIGYTPCIVTVLSKLLS